MMDGANPDIEEVLQEDPVGIRVPVEVCGPVTTHELPSRVGAVFDAGLTTAWTQVLSEDFKRKRVLLVSSSAWILSHGPWGGAAWPANVPLEWRNGSELYAKHASSTATLTIIVEEWAD